MSSLKNTPQSALPDPFRLEERLAHKINRAEYLLPLVLAAMLWIAGFVDLLVHPSPDPQLFGRYSLVFFVAMLVYALGFVGLYGLIVPRESLERVRAAIGFVQARAWLGLAVVGGSLALAGSILIWNQWLYFPLLSICMLVLSLEVVLVFTLLHPDRAIKMQLWRKIVLAGLVAYVLVEVALQVAAYFRVLPVQNLSGLFVPYGRIYQTTEGFSDGNTNRYGYYYPEFKLRAGFRILLKGDGDVQALQIRERDHFGLQLQAMLKDLAAYPDGAEVLALGYPGYGPGLYADTVLYPFTDAPFKPSDIIVVFNLANDLQTVTGPTRSGLPYYTLDANGAVVIDEGSLLARHDLQHAIIPGYDPINLVKSVQSRLFTLEIFDAWWRGWRDQPDSVPFFASNLAQATDSAPFGPATFAFESQGGPEAERAFAIATGLIETYRAHLASQGVTLRLVTVPHFPADFYQEGAAAWTADLGGYDLFAPDRALADYAAEAGVPYVSLGAALQARSLSREQVRELFYSSGTGGLTAAGHAVVADVVFACFYAPGDLDCPTP